MTTLLQQLVDGVAAGMIYGSLALALVFVYRASGVINFAQGEMGMISAYFVWMFTTSGMGVWTALAASMLLSFIMGAALQVVLIRRVENADELTIVTVTLGVFLVLNNLAGYIWGFVTKSVPSAFPGGVWRIQEIAISKNAVGMSALLIAVVVLLYLALKHTWFGLAIRAVASSRLSSQLSGIGASRVSAAGWGLAAVLGGLSGALVAPKLFLDPNMMFGVLVYAFAAAALGGLTSIGGALVGGVTIGILENLASQYISFVGSDLKVGVPLLVLVIVLLVKPHGLFGIASGERV